MGEPEPALFHNTADVPIRAPGDPPSAAAFQPPVVPDHELLKRIGGGSYGEVWLARNVLGECRAVKVIYRDKFEHDRPFEREFEGSRKFEPISRLHESQVDILHVGRNDAAGYFYYVMELAGDASNPVAAEVTRLISKSDIEQSLLTSAATYQPRTLKLDLYRQGRLPVDECVRIGLALTTALEHLHGHGLVHRDIKPSNIIFVNGVPKLADIGLVASMDATMSFVGTSGFLPPEGPGTPQGDIYSLGKVLYEISMGRDRQEFPKLPSDLLELTNPDALVEFNEILLKACESEARRRYQSAEEMRADLEFLQRGQSIKRKRTEEQRWAVYRKVGLAVVLLAFIAILGSIGLRQFEPRPTGSRLQPSTNHEATILYDQARRIIEADDYKRYGFAWSNLNTAVQIDTNFTAAYALMSQMAIGEAWAINVEDRILTLRKLASRLMTLDSRLAESHCAESCVQFFDWEFDKAEKSIRRAIQLNPDCWLAHSLHGYYLCLWGHAERGRRELQIAERLEPSFAINQFCLGMPFYVDRKWDDAARQFSEALRLNPKLPFAHFWLGRVYQIRHEYSKAIEEFREAAINFGGNEAEATEPARQLQAAFDKDGESGYWQKCRELQQMKPSPNGYVIYVHLGARGEAIDLLRQSIHAHQIKDGGPVELLFDECWDDMRADPEFEKLVAEMKFPR